MIGAIIGDVVGSAFEFNPIKTKEFELFSDGSKFTDDTVCTLAIAECFLYRDFPSFNDFELSLLNWCHRYPDVGYGKQYKAWMNLKAPSPYQSFGNGSAMRVSPVAYALLEKSREAVRDTARLSAVVTHDHEEGIKGAQAAALAIVYADKVIPLDRLEKEFGYDLSTPIETIKQDYGVDTTCQGSVPQAIRAAIEGHSFEDTIRLAVSLGGDCDTQAAIAGAIAQAQHPVPLFMIVETLKRLPPHFVDVINRFNAKYGIEFHRMYK